MKTAACIPLVIAALSVVIAASGVSATTSANVELAATVDTADGAETFANPGCGMAGGGWSALSPGMKTNGLDLCANVPNCTKLWYMNKFSKGHVYKNAGYYTNHVMRFVGGADIPLDENALLCVSNSLLKCRRNGGSEAIDQAVLSRMGFYNDGYLGTDWDYGTWGGAAFGVQQH